MVKEGSARAAPRGKRPSVLARDQATGGTARAIEPQSSQPGRTKIVVKI
jgi:hypothetical protein